MLNKKSKIYIAGHNGLVGSSILRVLKKKGYKNIYIPGRYLKFKHEMVDFRRKSPKTELLLNNVEKSRKLFFHKWEHIFRTYFQHIYEKQAELYNNDSN